MVRNHSNDNAETQNLPVKAGVRLVHYNTEHPQLSYRNMGRRPIETVMEFVT